ncbi:MAG TPA: hypothetical protein VN673_11610, partial [Clostridia bacterium]|nr:hypothetical protein [Clostridia bacterium]
MAVFGQTPAGIHISLALANAASVILLFLIGRHILDDVAGIFAAATFGIMSLSPTLMGLTGHANHLLILFVLAGSWLVLRVQLAGNAAADLALSRRLQPLLLLLSGLLFAAALLTTVQGSLFALSAVAYVAWIWIEPRLPKDERRIHPKLVWLMSHLPRKDSPELARKPVLHRPTHVQGLRWLGIQLGTFCAGFFLLLLLGLMLLW